MSQILTHFFVSNPMTRQECYKLVKAEILKLAPNICYFTQLLRLDIVIVKIYYRLSSDLYRKYVLSLLWHLHGSSSSWPTSGRSMPEVVLLDFGNCPLFIYRRPTLIWTNLSKSNLLVISAVQCNSTQIYCIPGTFFIHLMFTFKRKDRICKETRHKGPEGWMFLPKKQRLYHKFLHKSWPFIFRISTKIQLHNLNQT